jgi:hypothetical protein
MLAYLLLAILPSPPVAAVDRCDLVELNHFYDEMGRLVFDQVIFYDWSDDEARFNVRAWRLGKHPSQLPFRDWESGGYRVTWLDGDRLRDVFSAHYRETWTQYDPELEEREHLPKDRRRELGRLTPCRGR